MAHKDVIEGGNWGERTEYIPSGATIRVSTSSAGLFAYKQAKLLQPLCRGGRLVIESDGKELDLGKVTLLIIKTIEEWAVEGGSVYSGYVDQSVQTMHRDGKLYRVECKNGDANALYFIQEYP